MNEKTSKTGHGPKSKSGKILINLLITLVVGAVYFYISLPALNFQSGELYTFIGLLCIVYVICSLITSGFQVSEAKGGVKDYLHFIKTQCLPVGILILALLAVAVVGEVISAPIFRAGAYRDLLSVEDGDFAKEVDEISFNEVPTLDLNSAQYLGNQQLGTLSDMVSQFEVSPAYTQINYDGQPYRVTSLQYADIIRWFTNRSEGLPAYMMVNMVTQKAEVVRLPAGEGMKYSSSEPLNRNVYRHLRFQYPTYMFSTPVFELNDEGDPYWICPRETRTIGLFGGTDIKGAVLMNALNGESTYYDVADVPAWVDNVYNPDLIAQQYNYHGTLTHGFINSIFGKRDVTVTTAGSNYIALDDDVYMYTGITSATSDTSNLGFLLSNQRTKETKYYVAPGATEQSAQASAMGAVQDLAYSATFPILLNIASQPTYFIPLKDDTQLVKMYAMVNVQQYNVLATDTTVAGCEQKYIKLLASQGITEEAELPQTSVSGVVAELRSAVMDGNSYYFVRLEDEDVFYSVSAKDNPAAVILNEGDTVTIEHAPETEGETSAILSGYTLNLDKKASGVLPSAPITLPEDAVATPAASPAPSAAPVG